MLGRGRAGPGSQTVILACAVIGLSPARREASLWELCLGALPGARGRGPPPVLRPLTKRCWVQIRPSVLCSPPKHLSPGLRPPTGPRVVSGAPLNTSSESFAPCCDSKIKGHRLALPSRCSQGATGQLLTTPASLLKGLPSRALPALKLGSWWQLSLGVQEQIASWILLHSYMIQKSFTQPRGALKPLSGSTSLGMGRKNGRKECQ